LTTGTTGAIRTATKRAGGTVNNHGGSPGKRLGLKKFSGIVLQLLYVNTPVTEQPLQISLSSQGT